MARQRQETHSDTVQQLEDGFLERTITATEAAPRQYVPKMELRQGQKRDLADVRKRLLAEADMAGESFYYGWGAGKDKIEGPSVKVAMSAARCWGNCSVEALPLQETSDSWIFTTRFVDFETGYCLERQFRQSKRWTVYGKHDAERKDDMRFQIGQSKSARNLVCNALPEWLISEAVERAKLAVRAKVEEYVKANGVVKAAEIIVKALVKAGVPEDRVLAKIGVAKTDGLTVDDIVILRGCLSAIQNGSDSAESIFGEPEAKKPAKSLSELPSKLSGPDCIADVSHQTEQELPPTLANDAAKPDDDDEFRIASLCDELMAGFSDALDICEKPETVEQVVERRRAEIQAASLPGDVQQQLVDDVVKAGRKRYIELSPKKQKADRQRELLPANKTEA